MAGTIFKETRKNHNLTRDEVCDEAMLLNNPITPERLERIENGKFPITPDEVMLLAEIYGEPTLCNRYCAKECPIGEKYVPEIKVKDLTQIVLEMLSSLNSMKKSQERLIEITADGIIDDDEIEDFVYIQKELEHISITVETLQLWVEQMLADEKINMEKYRQITSE
ncbi:MAG: helix-turn-helix transcriptional regulator [Ruminococcaceae bacterium]|nr:helix-turn-helix transcriptional regulator [Oscillospiraceae bacterium]